MLLRWVELAAWVLDLLGHGRMTIAAFIDRNGHHWPYLLVTLGVAAHLACVIIRAARKRRHRPNAQEPKVDANKRAA